MWERQPIAHFKCNEPLASWGLAQGGNVFFLAAIERMPYPTNSLPDTSRSRITRMGE